METNSEFHKFQTLLYIEHDYDKAIDILSQSDNIGSKEFQYLLGEAFFFKHDFDKAAMIFQNLNDMYKVGYCKLLQGNSDEALSIWKQTPTSPAQNWGIFFCELFTAKVTISPTYLQIRAFLERDLNLFLKINLTEYVQKIIDISELLFEINPETNKIIAKAFLYNDYPEYAKEYLQRAFDYTDADAELYYLTALYEQKINNISEAKKALKKALEINPNYIPVKNLLENL